MLLLRSLSKITMFLTTAKCFLFCLAQAVLFRVNCCSENRSWLVKSVLQLMAKSVSDKWTHKVLTYVEYRAVSGVFQNIDPPPPLPLASVSSPCTKGGGVHTHRPVRGWGVNILEDARHWIGLLQFNPSTNGHIYNRFFLTGMLLPNIPFS